MRVVKLTELNGRVYAPIPVTGYVDLAPGGGCITVRPLQVARVARVVLYRGRPYLQLPRRWLSQAPAPRYAVTPSRNGVTLTPSARGRKAVRRGKRVLLPLPSRWRAVRYASVRLEGEAVRVETVRVDGVLVRATAWGVPIPPALAPFTSKYMILTEEEGVIKLKPAPDLDRLGVSVEQYEQWLGEEKLVTFAARCAHCGLRFVSPVDLIVHAVGEHSVPAPRGGLREALATLAESGAVAIEGFASLSLDELVEAIREELKRHRGTYARVKIADLARRLGAPSVAARNRIAEILEGARGLRVDGWALQGLEARRGVRYAVFTRRN